MITASSAALAQECGYSFRADVPKPATPEATGAQSRGTAFGLLAEQAINRGPPVSVADLAEAMSDEDGMALVKMWNHGSEWLRANKLLGWRAEVAYAYDPITDVARELPRLAHRDYSGAGPGDVCGTADIVAIKDETVVIYDWKTTSDGAPAVDATAQLEWLALMAARAWGYDSARIVTLKVTIAGLEAIEGKPLDLFDLADIRARIQAVQARVPTSEPQPGSWCSDRYCKLLTTCDRAGRGAPAALAQVIPAEMLARRYVYGSPIEDAEQLRWYVEVNAIVKKAQEAAGKMVSAYVTSRDGRVACEDGAEVYAATRDMPRQDKRALDALLKRLGATDEDIQSTWRVTREPAGVKVRKAK